MRYQIRHQIASRGRLYDVSPHETREARSVWLAAWCMRGRIRRRFGVKLEIQRYPGGVALWRPGEEIRLEKLP